MRHPPASVIERRHGAAASVVRSLVFALFQLVVTPLYAAIMVLTFWLPRMARYRIAASWCAVMMWGARLLCGIRWRAIGREHIPHGRHAMPHVIVCKHSSTWETLALTRYFPAVAYVAKKELLAIPFFGWGFGLASPITIDRKAGGTAMQQIVKQGRERFAQGFWIAVYPEGTRIPVGTRAKYKTGGARLAIELGASVLPVAHNAGYLWPKGSLGKRPGTVTISFGPPMSSAGKDPQTFTSEIEAWIESEVARLSAPR